MHCTALHSSTRVLSTIMITVRQTVGLGFSVLERTNDGAPVLGFLAAAVSLTARPWGN